jgi:hypothetical protein
MVTVAEVVFQELGGASVYFKLVDTTHHSLGSTQVANLLMPEVRKNHAQITLMRPFSEHTSY